MINRMQTKLTISLIALATIFFTMPVFAQVRSGDVSLSVSPEHPAPNENVQARVSTYTIDLNKAYISWRVNGQILAGGVGKTAFSFDMGPSGSQTELTASIDTTDGQSVIKTVYLSPIDIDLLWEGVNSFTPPFYRGKKLVAKEGEFKIAALPTTGSSLTGNSNFSFQWSKDNNPNLAVSGWGKNKFSFKNSYIDRSNTIEVKVSDIKNIYSSSKKINLVPGEPEIVFYGIDNALGIKMNQSIEDGYNIKKGGETIVAMPYFLNSSILENSRIEFLWNIGGQRVDTVNPRNQVSLVPEGGKQGASLISLTVNNLSNLFPGVTKAVNLNF